MDIVLPDIELPQNTASPLMREDELKVLAQRLDAIQNVAVNTIEVTWQTAAYLEDESLSGDIWTQPPRPSQDEALAFSAWREQKCAQDLSGANEFWLSERRHRELISSQMFVLTNAVFLLWESIGGEGQSPLSFAQLYRDLEWLVLLVSSAKNLCEVFGNSGSASDPLTTESEKVEQRLAQLIMELRESAEFFLSYSVIFPETVLDVEESAIFKQRSDDFGKWKSDLKYTREVLHTGGKKTVSLTQLMPFLEHSRQMNQRNIDRLRKDGWLPVHEIPQQGQKQLYNLEQVKIILANPKGPPSEKRKSEISGLQLTPKLIRLIDNSDIKKP